MQGRGRNAGGSAVPHAPHGEAGRDALPHQAGIGSGRPGEGAGDDLQVGRERTDGGAQRRKDQTWWECVEMDG